MSGLRYFRHPDGAIMMLTLTGLAYTAPADAPLPDDEAWRPLPERPPWPGGETVYRFEADAWHWCRTTYA